MEVLKIHSSSPPGEMVMGDMVMSNNGEFGDTPDAKSLCKLYIGRAAHKEYARYKTTSRL